MKSRKSYDNSKTAHLVRRLWSDYMRSFKGHLIIGIIAMIIGALATGAQAWMIQPALDRVLVARDELALLYVPAAIIVVMLIEGFSGYIHNVALANLAQKTIERLQDQMFARLIRADLTFLNKDASGINLSRFLSDTSYLREAMSKTIVGMARDSIKVVVLVGVMFYQDWRFALGVFLVFPLSVWPVIAIGKRLRSVSRRIQVELGNMTAVLDDSLKGVRQVQSFCMEDYEAKRALSLFELVRKLNVKLIEVRSRNYPIMSLLSGVAVGGVILYGGLQIAGDKTSVGQFMSFLGAMMMAYQPLRSLASMNASLQTGLAAAERIFDLIDGEPDIQDRPGAVPLSIGEGAVRFEGVSFSYGGDKPVLSDLDLEIRAGMKAALVGPSGAGKSTVLNLIPRFYDVTEGRVIIDGQDVRDVTLESLRSQIGLVSQDTILFNDTVAANIAYGRPETPMEEIVEAARKANAHDFIMQLPEGYDTPVAERGQRLSGGQRQRIAIARAILKDAPILLLDEATSSLDVESERIVQAALDRLMEGRTTLVIAHRLSTIVNSDVIFVMQDGKVVAKGSHTELIETSDLYRTLYKYQGLGDIE